MVSSEVGCSMFFHRFKQRFLLSAGAVTAVFWMAPYAVDAGELVFSTAPTQSPEVTRANYQPLISYLEQASGAKVVIKPARSFYEYSRRMRNGEYDIVFDGPHFIKYRMEKQNHVVLARQPGTLHFVVVVKDGSGIQDLAQLRDRRVCSPATPHLGTLTFLDLFSNPVRQPSIVPVQSFKHALACVREGRAKAAVFRDKFWDKKVKNKTGLKVIHVTERKLPDRAISINANVDPAVRLKMASALVGASDETVTTALASIGGTAFRPADQRDYSRQEDLLKMVWGFHL